MKKEMEQLVELLSGYGIVMEKRYISKCIREKAVLLVRGNRTSNGVTEAEVLEVLSDLIKGKNNGERLIKDFEKFALKTKMDEEKKEMNKFYANCYYFRYDFIQKRIRAFPYRTFNGFETITYTLESYAAGYANTLSPENRLEFDLKNAFDKEAAMEFLREKVNFIFVTIAEDYEMAEALENLSIEFKAIVATMLEKQIEKQLKKMEKELVLTVSV